MANPKPMPKSEATRLSPEAAAFVEEMGLLLSRGLPRMAGRLFGYLLICDPPEQTATQLAEALGASAGSISGMTRLLITLRLAERLRLPGERADRVRIAPGAIANLLSGQLEYARAGRQLMERGKTLVADLPPPARQRVEETHDMYAFWERELPELIERWNAFRRNDT